MTHSTLKLQYEAAVKKSLNALELIGRTKNIMKRFNHESNYRYYSREAARIDEERRLWLKKGIKQDEKETVGESKNKYA